MMARPWVKFLLIASLALNVLIAGMVGGMFLRGSGGWHAGGSGGGNNIFAFMAQLPKERRDALHTKAHELRGTVRELRETVRAASKERAVALGAEPFDRQRYINAQTRQIEADTKLRLLMRDAVAQLAADMTLEERRAFLKWRGQRRMVGPSDASLDEPPAPRKP
jgi:uncharacterized membrane protein